MFDINKWWKSCQLAKIEIFVVKINGYCSLFCSLYQQYLIAAINVKSVWLRETKQFSFSHSHGYSKNKLSRGFPFAKRSMGIKLHYLQATRSSVFNGWTNFESCPLRVLKTFWKIIVIIFWMWNAFLSFFFDSLSLSVKRCKKMWNLLEIRLLSYMLLFLKHSHIEIHSK